MFKTLKKAVSSNKKKPPHLSQVASGEEIAICVLKIVFGTIIA